MPNSGFSIIAAVAQDGAIGQDGGLPWGRIEADMRWFQAVTVAQRPHSCARELLCHPERLLAKSWQGMPSIADIGHNAVIVGRRTRNSMQSTIPLPQRLTITVSAELTEIARGERESGTELYADSLHAALLSAEENFVYHIFVAGGAQLYAEALQHPACERLYLTEVEATYPDADTWWPVNTQGRTWQRMHSSDWLETPNGPRMRFGIWEREGQ